MFGWIGPLDAGVKTLGVLAEDDDVDERFVEASVGLFAAIVVLIIFGSPVVHSGNLALLLAAVAPAAFENALS